MIEEWKLNIPDTVNETIEENGIKENGNGLRWTRPIMIRVS